ncbi:Cytochrome oxidase maturation protein cbb3-type [Pigmentiphaga humi]|uniref:Cytochrome oxidase maturation protein cbb3-type n=1 Tax=Pigmentiphaga humi TaxID=2478468 RepID=A0A3P4AZV1_9BURK|nr:cbb3-type cytochrome oxidase assembly protein CcoS [Pigmentiphaga humi]VCU68375.1 Cytochrome oxidase maturation protein cbb3-type [Pigmentiphaga humi]
METLYLLIPLSLMLVLAVAGALWWAVSDGQFEDIDSAGHAILMDDDAPAGEADAPHPGQRTHDS